MKYRLRIILGFTAVLLLALVFGAQTSLSFPRLNRNPVVSKLLSVFGNSDKALAAGAANLHATTATFASVWNSAGPGDVIALASGNYGTFSGGSKSSVVTIQPEPGATAVMSLSFTPADHIKIDGLTIAGVQFAGAHDITISNSTFTVAALVRTSGVLNAHILFDHDTFDNLPVDTYEGRLSVIGNSDSAPVGITISNSHFGGGCSDGVDVLGGAYGVVIGPGNEFTNINQAGCDPVHVDPIQFYGDSHTTVTGNWFHDNGSGSGGIMTPDGSSGGVITNNVFASTGYAYAINCGGCTNFLFSHNTVNPSQSIHFANSNEGAPSTGNTITNNIAQGGIQSAGSTEDYNLVSGGGSGSHDINGNPVYAGGSVPGNFAGYKLASNSPGLARASDGSDMGISTGASVPDTTAPSVPAGLTATAGSSSQINLLWVPSSDSVGVAGYKIFRGGALIGTSVSANYSDTGLAASTAYAYSVSAYDAAGNNSAQSASAGAATPSALVSDTTSPSVSTGLSATAISSSQINLSWTASTDNVGVTGYKILRGGTQIGTSATNSYRDTGLLASKNYSYTVSASDAAGNNSSQSASANATTLAPAQSGGTPVFVQAATASRDATGGALTTPGITTASGDLFIVAVAWDNSTNAAMSVSDSKGNVYTAATAKQTYAPNNSNLQIFYAASGAGGPSHTFTVTPSVNAPWFRAIVHEVSGIQATGALDQTAVINNEAGTAVTVGPMTTASSGDYIFAVADDNSGSNSISANSPYAERATAAPTLAELQSQDTVHSASGPIASTWTLNGTDTVMAQMAAFRAGITGADDTQAPTAPSGLTATSTSPSQIALTWAASTDNVAVTGYKIYRDGAQIGTSAANSYGDTGLTASTVYTYAVSAYDAAGNTGSQSSAVSATTQAATPVINSLVGSATDNIYLTWDTSVPTNGQIFYGLTSVYGVSTALLDNTIKTTTHSATLTNLTPSTLYHFKVVSTDNSGKSVSSPDFTFTTLAVGSATHYIPATPGLPSTGVAPTISIQALWYALIILIALGVIGLTILISRKKRRNDPRG